MQGGKPKRKGVGRGGRGELGRNHSATSVDPPPHPRSGMGTGPTHKEPGQGAEVLISLPSWKLPLQEDLPFTLARMGCRGGMASLSPSLCCPHVIHDHLSQSPSNLRQGNTPESIASQRMDTGWP